MERYRLGRVPRQVRNSEWSDTMRKRLILCAVLFGMSVIAGKQTAYATEVTPTTQEAVPAADATQTEVPAEPVTVEETMKLSARTKGQTVVYEQAFETAAQLVVIEKKQEVLIRGQLTVGGVKWAKISTKVSGRTIRGYVKMSRLKKYNMFAQTTGKTNASQVIMRKAAGTGSAKAATLKSGVKLTVYAKVKKNKQTWYQVSAKVGGKKRKGYILAKYVTLTKTTAGTTRSTVATAKKAAPFYRTANTKDQMYTTLSKGTVILLLGNIKINGVKWNKIQTGVDGKDVIGYIKASQVGKYSYNVTDYTKYGIGKLKKTYNLRSEPNAYATKTKQVKKGIELCLDGYVKANGELWYHCSFLNYYGFVPESMLNITDAPSDDPFYNQLLTFPDTYKDAIWALHKAHPNWQFVGVDTGLNWKDVVANQNVVGRNTIYSTYPTGGRSGAPLSYLSTANGAYDWATDTYKVKDGKTWFAASEAVIKYYLDPRNFLNETGIYQFEVLSYSTDQSIDVVNAILSGTFMSGNYSVIDKYTGAMVSGAYNQLFMNAGAATGVSPYFLARTAKLELGSGGSGSVSGSYPGYEGIYNYFNIGANDSAGGGAVANGLRWASGGYSGSTSYSRPWTNPEKAITGGALYIAESYINKGQNTSYYKKFNVINRTDGLYRHQYYTNVQGASSEAQIAKRAYDACKMTNGTMLFYIPFYSGMPKTPCKLPAAKGNPNHYLKSLSVSVDGEMQSFDQAYSYQTTDYTMTVPKGTTAVTVGADTISKYAKVSVNGTAISNGGSRTVAVKAGKTTTVSVVCTAGNGKKLTYKIKIKA